MLHATNKLSSHTVRGHNCGLFDISKRTLCTRIDVTTKDTVVLMLYVFSQPLIGPANTTILPDQSEASKKHVTLAQQYHLSLRQF